MSPQAEDRLSSPKSPGSSSTLSEKDSSETVSSQPQIQDTTPKTNRMKDIKHIDFEGITNILRMVVDEEVIEIYLQGVKLNENNEIERVKFPVRKLNKEHYQKPKSSLAFIRKGYSIEQIKQFYKLLFDQKVVIKSLSEFELMILPIFYLIHGEAFDSQSPYTSYCIQRTQKQINIKCHKCKNNEFHTLNVEFQFHMLSQTDEPLNIQCTKRGAIFHALHYEDKHPLKYIKLHQGLFTNKVASPNDQNMDEIFLDVNNEPLDDDMKTQLCKEINENRKKIKEYIKGRKFQAGDTIEEEISDMEPEEECKV